MTAAPTHREIKFRIWDNFNKRMLDTFSELCHHDEYDLLYFGNGHLDVPVGDNLNIMQYTGLKDKLGKEIYEGDIVKLTCSSNKDHAIIANIEWRGVSFIPTTKGRMIKVVGGSENGKTVRMSEMHSWCGMHDCFSSSKNIEVIGNIYQDEELQ